MNTMTMTASGMSAGSGIYSEMTERGEGNAETQYG